MNKQVQQMWQRRLNRNLFTLFIRLVPQSYQNALLRELCKRDPGTLNPLYQFMDYPKHEIFVYQGIRKLSCQKEPETVRWLENYIKPGQVLFDVGANIGAYSLIAAKYHKGTVKVYAFEPAFQNYSILVKNILQNDCSEIIFSLNAPLDEAETLATFNYSSIEEGSACHAFGDPIDYKGESFQPVFKQLAMSNTIDRLVQHYGLPRPNHMKLDVDGLELKILKGAKTTISGDYFKSLLVEVSERFDLEELSSFLRVCGLHFSEKYDHPATSNYIYIR